MSDDFQNMTNAMMIELTQSITGLGAKIDVLGNGIEGIKIDIYGN